MEEGEQSKDNEKDESDKNNKNEDQEIIDNFLKQYGNQIKFTGKKIGRKIYEIILNKTISGAGKIVNSVIDKNNEINFSYALKGRNIIRQHAIYEIKMGEKTYNLLVMEKAKFPDLYKFNTYIKNKNFLKTIYTPFKINLSENLLRFYLRQIVHGLLTIRKYGFVHLDLKPQNILVTNNLEIKISNFSKMKNIKVLEEKEAKIKLPGSTDGFAPPEYLIDPKLIDKVDIFSLGACIFKLYTGEFFLDIPKNISEKQQIIEVLKIQFERNIKRIDSMVNEGVDKDFISLLKKMLKFNPEDRIDFEFIYRNKWINKNSKEIEKISEYYEKEEEKIIMEIQKSDILLKYYENGKINKKAKFEVHKMPKKYRRKNSKTNKLKSKSNKS